MVLDPHAEPGSVTSSYTQPIDPESPLSVSELPGPAPPAGAWVPPSVCSFFFSFSTFRVVLGWPACLYPVTLEDCLPLSSPLAAIFAAPLPSPPLADVCSRLLLWFDSALKFPPPFMC